MAGDPTDAERLAFVDSMLSNLDRRLREPAVVKTAISDNRPLWVALYRASLDFSNADEAKAS